MSNNIWSDFSSHLSYSRDGNETAVTPVVSNRGSSIGTTADDESLASQVETGIPSEIPFHRRNYRVETGSSAKRPETSKSATISKILPNWARTVILLFIVVLVSVAIFVWLFYSTRDTPQESTPKFNFEALDLTKATTFPSPAPSLRLTKSPSVSSSVSPSRTASENPTVNHSSAPTMTLSKKPSINISTAPTSTPTTRPTAQPAVSPTSSPSIMPSSSPTVTLSTSHPTKYPTSMPSMPPKLSDLVFYVMGDVPYSGRELIKLRKLQLPSIPEETPFVFHVGDIQNVKETNCTEMAYKEVYDVFKLSKIPIFFTPGEQDYKECPNPDEAWGNWTKYFGKFDHNYNHTLGVHRQMFRNENVAFFQDYVLFVGVHIIPGTHDEDELANRLNDNLEWLISNVNQYLEDDLRSVVVFSHADKKRDFKPFFEGFSELANKVKIPFLYVHGHGHDFELTEQDFDSPYITNLQVDKGRRALPLKVTAMRDTTEPFIFDRRLTPDWGAYWDVYPKNETSVVP